MKSVTQADEIINKIILLAMFVLMQFLGQETHSLRGRCLLFMLPSQVGNRL
jgi:hypothetical protein